MVNPRRNGMIDYYPTICPECGQPLKVGRNSRRYCKNSKCKLIFIKFYFSRDKPPKIAMSGAL